MLKTDVSPPFSVDRETTKGSGGTHWLSKGTIRDQGGHKSLETQIIHNRGKGTAAYPHIMLSETSTMGKKRKKKLKKNEEVHRIKPEDIVPALLLASEHHPLKRD